MPHVVGQPLIPASLPRWRPVLTAGARSMGVALDDREADLLLEHAALLQHWGARVNLSTQLEPASIIAYHLLDSLALLASFPPDRGARLVDLGSGAGFPGLPLKVVRPDLHLVLVESNLRRAELCRAAIGRLALEGIEVRGGRAEDLAADPALRGSFAMVTSRALAALPRFLDLACDFLQPGGLAVAWKGPSEEPTPGTLPSGWSLLEAKHLVVPGKETARTMVACRRK